ncbi:hypothetical protein AAFF_G00126670 [Aldrovandia affinis]|uniref:Uncharacterized protein n=1 Tax=Aldrovandia affinis TaxID=143900 RepID=A0AAD7RTX0_9TELE|nr:hypothetical protein AAFF_G00126670 [Aldrovandia affinis]
MAGSRGHFSAYSCSGLKQSPSPNVNGLRLQRSPHLRHVGVEILPRIPCIGLEEQGCPTSGGGAERCSGEYGYLKGQPLSGALLLASPSVKESQCPPIHSRLERVLGKGRVAETHGRSGTGSS